MKRVFVFGVGVVVCCLSALLSPGCKKDGKPAAASVLADSVWKVEELPSPPCLALWRDDGSGESVTNAAGETATHEWLMSKAYEEVAQMAIARLDRHYGRCSAEVLETLVVRLYRKPDDEEFWMENCLLGRNGRLLTGDDHAHLTWQGWRLTDRFYLLLEGEEACCIRGRYYTFVFFDGVTARAGAAFDDFPTPRQANAALQALRQ